MLMNHVRCRAIVNHAHAVGMQMFINSDM